MTSPNFPEDAAGVQRSLVPSTLRAALLTISLLAGASCSEDDGPAVVGQDPGGGNPPGELRLNQVSTGFGLLLPHTVARAGSNDLVTIRSIADIAEHVSRINPILPTALLPTAAIEPDGIAGNHYLYASFTEAIDPFDVLSPSSSGSGLEGAVTMTAVDSANGATFSVPGRAFVGGQTVVLEGGQPQLETWATYDSAGGVLVPNPAIPEAQGFPGLRLTSGLAETLVSPSTILFVADDDSDLTEFDTFPEGVTLRFRATTSLVAANGVTLENPVLATTTVGQDLQSPELLRSPPPSSRPLITPGNGDVNVDPETSVQFEFTEPIQPFSLGEMVGQGPPLLSTAVQISFGPVTGPVYVPMNVRPVSPFDLSVYEAVPGFAFPGSGPSLPSSSIFSVVEVQLMVNQVEDLSSRPDSSIPGGSTPNFNTRGADTFFETAEGVGLVNAPVAPDVIFAGRGGSQGGLSVVDLNGFGQSTGNPISSSPFPLEGESRFPYDPNVTGNPSVRPILTPGGSTVDGGSAGVFTLTLDHHLQDRLVAAPTVAEISDVHFAHALDSVMRNGPPPFGCQAGGGNVCSLDGLKVISFLGGLGNSGTIVPAGVGTGATLSTGYENLISWAPHPNPPGLAFPPLCVSPYLGNSEPTSIDVIPNGGGVNLLEPGNPFPDPAAGTPPTGLLALEQNQFFVGPSFGQTDVVNCRPYQIRGQVGHFLYIADRARNEIVVFNSNRMVVLERIALADPTSMAVAPNLDLLAVASQLADTVSLIDINPASATFHQVISEIAVGDSPRGLAFEPSNEDLLVCNELDSSLTIISMSNLLVRRTVTSGLDRPFELAVTPRMTSFAFERNVYFAYILDRVGACAVFESGPNSNNGWGFDDVLGTLPFEIKAPKAIQVDPLRLSASVYVVHEGPLDPLSGSAGDLGDGAISQIHLNSALQGEVLLDLTGGTVPNFRDLGFRVLASISQGDGQLSGIPVDLAFDNQRNVGGTRGPVSTFSAGIPIPANSKATVRVETQLGNFPHRTNTPSFLFAAVPELASGESGVIDTIDLGAPGQPRFDVNPYLDGVQSIAAPGVTVLSDYFRQ